MGRKAINIPKKKLYEAIRGSGGIVSEVARRIGRDWTTVKKRIDADDYAKELLEEERNKVLDKAEGTIIKAIERGSPADMDTIKWFLAKKGRDRGYGDTIEIVPNAVEELLRDLSKLTAEDKKKLLREIINE